MSKLLILLKKFVKNGLKVATRPFKLRIMEVWSREEKNKLISDAISFVKEGGAIAMKYFRKDLTIENKDVTKFDPVTEADKNTELKIRSLIEENYPNDNILGEEYGKKEGTSNLTWVIDPIDGTKAFISGMPTWGVLLSVVSNSRAILGVIYQPLTGEIFVGSFGDAFFTLSSKVDVKKAIKVRECESLENAIVATSYPSSPLKSQQANLETVLKNSRLDRYGLDCYAYALLAYGQLDAVVEFGLQEYDIRAPEALILSAGGIITNLDGSYPLSGGDVVASGDKRVHQRLVSIFGKSN